MTSILSDMVVARTYSKIKEDGTKETFDDIVDRYQQELIDAQPRLTDQIVRSVSLVREMRIMPSMRMLQFAMLGIKRENMRGFNCSALNITSFKDIIDVLYVSMCGTGVGFSCKHEHVRNLPVVKLYEEYEYLVMDSKEGWALSVARLLENPRVKFNYMLLRPAGATLSTGGTSSGPEPLMEAHEAMRSILLGAVGRQLTSFEVHSIVCLLASAVVVGGVRRSALISLFDHTDREMLTAKSGQWWEKNPHFARANNSAHLVRGKVTQEEFNSLIDYAFDSFAGEPGALWTNDPEFLTNPCAEISLRSHGVCNLTEINLAKCRNQNDFHEAVWHATFLGTLQASFTSFNFISPQWQKTAEEDALLGVSITGIGQKAALLQDMIANGSLRKAAEATIDTNRLIAKAIGINPAKRITTIKPSGTVSCVLDTTSGIHAAHAPYYLRRIRIDKTDPVAGYLHSQLANTPFIEEDVFNNRNYVVGVPYHMPNALYRRDLTAVTQLEFAAQVYENWVKPGHVEGANSHNVSQTISYRETERGEVKAWMWANQDRYQGVSLLPLDESTYVQAPYEEISKEQYESYMKQLPKIDISSVVYADKSDNRSGEAACAGGACEIK